MKTINLSDEDYQKVKEVLAKAESKPEKKTIIYKTDGSVLYESDKESVKEAVVEAVDKDANLQGADLRGADLWEADLRGADLRGADLWEADLRGADLREANLWEADLRGADLREANLQEAELQNAKFYGKGGTTKIKKSQVDNFFKALGIVVE